MTSVLSIAVAVGSVLGAATQPASTRAIMRQMVPADAVAAIYVQDVGRAMAGPAGLAASYGQTVLGRRWVPAVADAVRGLASPALIVVLPAPEVAEGQPAQPPHVLIALDLAGATTAGGAWVDALLAKLGTGATSTKDGAVGSVTVDGKAIGLHWATRGDMLVLCSDRVVVSSWVAGAWPTDKLILSEAYQPLAEKIVGDKPLWAYAALEHFYSAFTPITAKDPILQQVYWVLGVQNFDVLAMEADVDGGVAGMRVALHFKDATQGLMGLLQGPAKTRTIPLPSDTPVVLWVGMSDLRQAIGAVHDLVGRVVPEIVTEFDADMAALKMETGVDLMGEVAANVSGELVLAMVPTGSGSQAAVLSAGVTDDSAFAAAMVGVAGHYGASWQKHERNGLTIYQPQGQGGFTWAIGRGRVALSWDPAGIEAVIRSNSTPAEPSRDRCRLSLGYPEGVAWAMDVVGPWFGATVAQTADWLGVEPKSIGASVAVRSTTVTVDLSLTGVAANPASASASQPASSRQP